MAGQPRWTKLRQLCNTLGVQINQLVRAACITWWGRLNDHCGSRPGTRHCGASCQTNCEGQCHRNAGDPGNSAMRLRENCHTPQLPNQSLHHATHTRSASARKDPTQCVSRIHEPDLRDGSQRRQCCIWVTQTPQMMSLWIIFGQCWSARWSRVRWTG